MLAVAVNPRASARLASSTASAHSVSPGLVTAFSAPEAGSGASTSCLPKSMHVHDQIYGSFTITEPLLIDLLHSQPIERLRSVLQHGITGLIGLTPSPAVTRYDHSVGAMLLVRAAGDTVEAQAAALLHDVAHTALSHVVDGVFGYVVHEQDKMEYLDETSIPEIIEKHGFDAERILEEANFPLLELDAPAVCADRLDYGIRDSFSFGFLTLEEASAIQRDLCVSNGGTFAFKTAHWARVLSDAYMKSDDYAWSNEVHSLLYQYAADTIRLAHSSGHMKKLHLWLGNDETFWRQMTESPSPDVQKLAARVHAGVRLQQIPTEDFIEGQDMLCTAKVRTLDPDILSGTEGQTRRLTEVDEQYRQAREAYLERKRGEQCWRVFQA